mgnify:CR=1 FL=1
MVEIWEENSDDQSVINIINCLNDKKGVNTVFLVLNKGDVFKDLFDLAKQVIEVNWPTNVVLLWLKTVSKLPDKLKEDLKTARSKEGSKTILSIEDLKAAVLDKKREIKKVFRKADFVDGSKIDDALFIQE